MSALGLILAATGTFPTSVSMATEPQELSVLSSAEARILGATLTHLAKETTRNADAVQRINETLHVLTRLEQAQTDVLAQLRRGSEVMLDQDKRLRDVEQSVPERLEERLQAIETQMPGLKEMRKWVIGGIMAGVGMIGLALVKLVLVGP